LNQIWHDAISENLRNRILASTEHRNEKPEKNRELGYLFDFSNFINFLQKVTKQLLKEANVLKILQKIEFSEGLVSLRTKTGLHLSFINFITNYDSFKQLYINRDKLEKPRRLPSKETV